MPNDIVKLAQEVLSAPLGDVISAVGRGVAEAQAALDEASLAQTLAIYSETNVEANKLMREIGYQPTFYALPETTGEIQVALSLSASGFQQSTPLNTSSRHQPVLGTINPMRLKQRQTKIYAAPVNSSLANRYSFQASASAKISFKIVPVPPPGEVSDIRVVPNLVPEQAMRLAEASERLALFDLTLKVVDDKGNEVIDPDMQAMVAHQSPAAGEISTIDQVVSVMLL